MTRSTKLRSLSCLSLLALTASARGQEASWLTHFRIGMSIGLNIKTEFKTTGTFPTTSNSPGDPTNPNVDHIYDDGYVRVDSTGNAPVPDPPNLPATSFWGYQNASQLTGAAPNQILTYHATKTFTGSAESSSDDSVHLGFDMAYGRSIAEWQRVAIGWEFGFNLTPVNAKDRQPISGSAVQSRATYNTGGSTIPSAPYSGPFLAAGSPLINAAGTALPDTVIPGTINGTRSIDAMLYQFRLGPLIRWEMYPRWTLNGSAGGAFGLVNIDYRFDESIDLINGTSTASHGKFGDLDTTFGGYASAVVMYDTGYNWEAFLGGHFIAMGDSKVSSGGREAKIDLGSAFYITVGINWTF